jgi:hypothetical protein
VFILKEVTSEFLDVFISEELRVIAKGDEILHRAAADVPLGETGQARRTQCVANMENIIT